MDNFCVFARTLDQTIEIATCIAPFLRLGDVILLTGGLASGKTYFVKALASALGAIDSVTSPTYAIANFYDIKLGKLIHIDVYRLSGILEFRDLGLEEFFANSITVVEWGEIVSENFSAYLSIKFTLANLQENHRQLTFSYVGNEWHAYMPLLSNKLSGFQE